MTDYAKEPQPKAARAAAVTRPTWLVRLPDERQQVARVAERWKTQFFVQGTWGRPMRGPADITYDKLAALPATATAQDVAAIIGNDTWIGHRCDGCKAYSNDAWQLGEEPDYESHTVVLCGVCMRATAEAYLAMTL